MTDEILKEREMEFYIASWTLIPGTGGLYEFTVDGELLYSKKLTGRHAEPGEIKKLLADRIAALRQEQG